MQLRPFQKEALQALKTHDHVVLVAATGSGKSLIFQEFLKQNPKLKTLLVTPLNALARQHAQNLKTTFAENHRSIEVRVGVGEAAEAPPKDQGVWVVNPERLIRDRRAKLWKADFMIVDEAHCVWEWGEGFRPEFKLLPKLIEDWGIQKSFWCTATLPPAARSRLLECLPEKEVIQLGQFSVPKEMSLISEKLFLSDRVEALYRYCHERSASLGIVFVTTRTMTERLARYFHQWGLPVYFYHAGMSAEERKNLELQLRKVDQGVILATSAFGMGMDLPQIRYSVLFQPPFTLLSLMQALGRATRSAQASEGLVYWHEDDFLRADWMVQGIEQRRIELMRVKEWCETSQSKRVFLEKYFNMSCN